MTKTTAGLLAFLALIVPSAGAQTFSVTALEPANGSMVARDAIVTATFDKDVDQTSVSAATFTVRGRYTGARAGTFTFPAANQVAFAPDEDFLAGEEITVVLNSGLKAGTGEPLEGWQVRFRAMGNPGPGTFRMGGVIEEQYASGWQPLPDTIFPADLDQDGDMDFVAAHRGDSQIFWYRNEGSLGFTQVVLASEGAAAVHVADMDGDGDLDVLAGHYLADKITLYRNDGEENFSGATVYSMDGVWALEVEDVDADGDLDVFAANSSELVWLRNSGAGTFTDEYLFSNAGAQEFMAPIDVDGDGDLDILAPDNRTNRLVLWKNNGSGGFSETTLHQSSREIQVGTVWDVDGDGRMDVVFQDASTRYLFLMRQRADGSFGTEILYERLPVLRATLSVSDFDGDGSLDVTIPMPGAIAWLEKAGSAWIPGIHVEDRSAPELLLELDMDGDGDLDFVSVQSLAPEFMWYEQVAADLEVSGNGMVIASGTVNPDSSDHTLFPPAFPADNGTSSRTFTLTNVGLGALMFESLIEGVALDGDGLYDVISVSGEHAGDFTAEQTFSEVPLAVSQTRTLPVRFRPTNRGVRTATITIGTNDPDEPRYSFTVQGSGFVALQAADDAAETAEDTAVTIGVLDNDDGWLGTAVQLESAGSPQSGSVSLSGDSVVYSPAQDFFGQDTFTYTISAGNDARVQGTVTVTVTPVNDAPTIAGIADQIMTEDTSSDVLSFTVADVDDTELTASATSSEQAVIADSGISLGGSGTDRTMVLTPVAGASGSTHITVTVTDGELSAEMSFEVVVRANNNPPSPPVLISPDDGAAFEIGGDPAAAFTFTWSPGADPDGDPLNYVLDIAPDESFGTVALRREVGAALELSLAYETLDSLLTALGTDLYDSANLHVRVEASDGQLTATSASRRVTLTRGTFVGVSPDTAVPSEFGVSGIYPNPWRDRATFVLDMPSGGDVHVRLFDQLGREVFSRPAGHLGAGWGQRVELFLPDMPNGIYFYRLRVRADSGAGWSRSGLLARVGH